MVGQGHTMDPTCCVIAWGQPEEGMAPPYPRQHTDAWLCAYVGSSSLWFPGSLPPPLGRLRRGLMRLAARQYCYGGSWGTHSPPPACTVSSLNGLPGGVTQTFPEGSESLRIALSLGQGCTNEEPHGSLASTRLPPPPPCMKAPYLLLLIEVNLPNQESDFLPHPLGPSHAEPEVSWGPL